MFRTHNEYKRYARGMMRLKMARCAYVGMVGLTNAVQTQCCNVPASHLLDITPLCERHYDSMRSQIRGPYWSLMYVTTTSRDVVQALEERFAWQSAMRKRRKRLTSRT